MTWRDQIEARTNAANMSTVWKHLKLSEKDAKIITSTDSERQLSTHTCKLVAFQLNLPFWITIYQLCESSRSEELFLGGVWAERERERQETDKLIDRSVFSQSPFLSNAQTDRCMTSKHRESYREQMAPHAFESLSRNFDVWSVCVVLLQIEHTSSHSRSVLTTHLRSHPHVNMSSARPRYKVYIPNYVTFLTSCEFAGMSTASLVSDEKRKGGCCWLLFDVKISKWP